VAEYCISTNVQARLTEAGVEYLVDANDSRTTSSAEVTTSVTPCIEWAGAEIDFAICNQLDPLPARQQNNVFLQGIAVDLAAFRLCGMGGRSIPESIMEGLTSARDKLKLLMQGKTIPGLTYPGQPNGDPRYDVRTSQPRVVNY
jgi:hypothetical protein